ncbi:ABC transporter permease [Shewanella aestuarii]|uniref:ABC transporter permease n=1 Tax=Shewanella aestuarii TaxID=1028752 RepID=A0A6G9QN98_9GAMM|nr:ABC transporter permease [Shewanella aestuarii]QIR16070.1 ABC transporter permease [Shewanella aestuarii]
MTLWQVMWRDFKAILSDKDLVLTIFGAMLFYSVLYPLPYLNQVPTEQNIVVVDHDNSSLSRQVIRHADASAKITVTAQLPSVYEAKQWITRGDAHGLLVIPEGFRRNLLLGKGATLSYGGDASYFLIYSAVVEGLVVAGMDASKQIQMVGLLARGETAAQVEKALDTVTINSVPAFNPSLGYTPYVVPGLFLLLLHQTLLIATSILGAGQWRQPGYWQQVSPLLLVSARILTFSTIYALFAALYLGYCFYFYNVSVLATMAEVGLFMVPFILATAALGVAVSSLFNRRDLPTQFFLLISMPILFVAGFVWPLALIPEPLVMASQVIPAVPAISGMLSLNQMGADWAVIFPQWMQLWLMLVVFGLLAWLGISVRQQQVNSD